MNTAIRRCLALCILFLLGAAAPAPAEERPPHAANPSVQRPMLLPPWPFGLDRQEALRLPGAKPGEGDFATDVMVSDANFADMRWTARLEFRENKLVRVSLMSPYATDRLKAVNAALRERGFEMLAMLAGDTKLDFVATLKTQSVDALRERIDTLARNRDVNRRAYAWFDTSKVSREMKVMVRTLNELLQVVGADTREAEVTLLGDTDAPSHMLVDFSLPILELQTFGKEK